MECSFASFWPDSLPSGWQATEIARKVALASRLDLQELELGEQARDMAGREPTPVATSEAEGTPAVLVVDRVPGVNLLPVDRSTTSLREAATRPMARPPILGPRYSMPRIRSRRARRSTLRLESTIRP
jgi:hypothetical protein